jgi:thioredoxin reductase
MDKADRWDVLVIGSGPAGLAAASAAKSAGARCCIVEREECAGGILKQCIHDGFGVIRYGERLTGPEYAWRELLKTRSFGLPIYLSTYLDSVRRDADSFRLSGVSPEGTMKFEAAALVLATGCRERTARQIFLHGSRPSGVLTAGLAQYFINIQGYMPSRRCVILGSGDIGLIMARRLRLEGAEVEGVYEIMARPSGLPRNLSQCLEDYRIPLHLSTTVTRVHGRERVEGVTVCRVDEQLRPIAGGERYIACDSLILSVGLIPENEIAAELGAEIDEVTGGPLVDEGMMTGVPGLYSCGNALHVSDLVDYVSAGAELAGRDAAAFAADDAASAGAHSGSSDGAPRTVPLTSEGPIAYILPQRIRIDRYRADAHSIDLSFRVRRETGAARLRLFAVDESGERIELKNRRFPALRPAEMETLTIRTAGGAEDRITAERILRYEAVLEEEENGSD